jgi:hypothetical protein
MKQHKVQCKEIIKRKKIKINFTCLLCLIEEFVAVMYSGD